MISCFICGKNVVCECKGEWLGKHNQPCLNREEDQYPKYVCDYEPKLENSNDNGTYFGHVCSRKCERKANEKGFSGQKEEHPKKQK
jgi:hypothetical protein